MKRVNWIAVGFVVWTIAFVELFVLIFLPTIRLWLVNRDTRFPVGWLLLAGGIAALVLGLSIIRRITRGSDGPDRWRSHRR
jgi:hypothetical protein